MTTPTYYLSLLADTLRQERQTVLKDRALFIARLVPFWARAKRSPDPNEVPFWVGFLEEQGIKPEEVDEALSKAEEDAGMAATLRALASQVKGLETKAQAEAFALGFQALCFIAEGICTHKAGMVQQGKYTLDHALDALKKVTNAKAKVEDIPQEDRTPAMEAMVASIDTRQEETVVTDLLREMEAIKDLASLGAWYEKSREVRETLRDPKQMDRLYGTIRDKKALLEKSVS